MSPPPASLRPLGLLLCLHMCARFAAAVPSPADYQVQTWTTDDGLPHNSVNAVLQDAAGYLWFATTGGLARFDGLGFREMRPPAEHRSYGFNIRGIAEERPGTLVVIPAGDTVLRLEGETWSEHPLNRALAELQDTPLSAYVDAQRNVWIACAQGGLLRWNADGRAKTFRIETGRTRFPRKPMLVSAPGGGTWIDADRLWLANADGELALVEAFGLEHRLVGAGRDGRLWVLADERLCKLDEAGRAQETKIPLQIGASGVRHLFEDSRGTLWIATSRQGLLRYAEGRLDRVTAYQAISSVGEDREGNLWVATDGNGVGQLREKAYRLVNASTCLRQDVVSSLSEDREGRLWLANRGGGLLCVNGEGAVQPGGLTGTRAFANVVCAGADGSLWFGGGQNGLLRWTPGAAEPEKMPLPSANLHLLFRARNGDLWFAADPDCVGYYRDGQPHLLPSGIASLKEIRAMAEDAEGALWLAGRKGELLRWHREKLELYDTAKGFPRAPVHALYADPEGPLWIGTAGGLVLKEGETFHLLTEADGLTDDIIEAMADDLRGNLWFASRRGLFRVRKADLRQAASEPDHVVESRRLGPSQGLQGLTPTANYHPTALRTRDGALWFATAQGAVAIDPGRLPGNLPLPPVLIDEVKLDGKAQAARPPLRLPSGRHRIDFHFAALSYTEPEAVRLRHKLEGADPNWVDTAPDRTANYTNLPPGTYRMRAIARNGGGAWGTEGATLDFTIVPSWWETLGFRLAATVLLGLLIALVVRGVVQRRMKRRLLLLEQRHAVEKERSRIARDLHDELGAGLTEVGLLADRLVETAPPELGRQLSSLAWRTRRLATDLSGIVWTMNASNYSLDHLAVFLRRYAERIFRNTGTRCVVLGIDAIPVLPLPPGLQYQLLAVTKEALNNVLKHARATEVSLALSCEEGLFEVRIADNGVGCPPGQEASSEGNGLRNMRTRIEESGGDFAFSSEPGAGATVVFRVAIAIRDPFL